LSASARWAPRAGDDVLTWYDRGTSVALAVPCANWMHFENGKIAQVRAAFDARGIAAGLGI